MTALPASAAFTGSTVTKAQFKQAITEQREFLAGLLGADGLAVTALATLGAALSGYVEKGAAFSVVVGNKGNLFDCTGTWTMSLLAAATAGSKFLIAVRNSGSGRITIDANASELIDGATTLVITPGRSVLLMCTGTAWVTVGSLPPQLLPTRYRELTSGTVYTPPTDVRSIRVFVTGATGGQSSNGYGGVGGAGYAEKLYTALAASYSYTIGAAGANTGTAGGTTSFDTISITSSGGVTSITASSGGVATGGDYNANGGAGGNGDGPSGGMAGGGGGGAGSRAGSGYAGGAASTASEGGGGGGTGGAGGTGASGGAAGATASTISATPITGFDDSPAFSFAAAEAGTVGDTIGGIPGNGGDGANANESAAGLSAGSATGGGHGGKYNGTNMARAGTAGKIIVWEYTL